MGAIPDYERVFEMLKKNAGQFYPTYAIAEACGLQANTVQRAINDSLIAKRAAPICKKHIEGSKVMSYAYVDGCVPGSLVDAVEEKKTVVAKRLSCPNRNCRADEFYFDEEKKHSKGKWLTTGRVKCVACKHQFELPKAVANAAN